MKMKFYNIQGMGNGDWYLESYGWGENGFIVSVLDNPPPRAFERVLKSSEKYQIASKKFYIIFPPDVLSVRITYEAQSWKIDGQITDWMKASGTDSYTSPFFSIDDSEYIEWYKQTETIDDIRRLKNIVHYMIFIFDVLIEVIDDRFPEITVEDYVPTEEDKLYLPK